MLLIIKIIDITVIITGAIINSRKLPAQEWMDDFKKLFKKFGKSTKHWKLYRGDEFQVEIDTPEEALNAVLLIKVVLKSLQLDARMSLGFGDKRYESEKITESNGTAFIRSGELFETLKKQRVNLAINSGNIDFDQEINLMLRLSLSFMDNWLQQSAEFILVAMEYPTASQEEQGMKLGINQAAVSRRQKRSNYDLVKDLDAYYRKKIKRVL